MISEDRALAFLQHQERPVELAWARYMTGAGSRDEVIHALSGYQNEDGGFGRNLEVDIEAPTSQPFAARLALRVMIETGLPVSEPVVVGLLDWLEREQGDDGCWRFASGVFEHPIAPWFQGWTFPSLNPALDIAGLLSRLGAGSVRLFERVERLIETLGSIEEARGGDFYSVLPYAEYVPWVQFTGQERYLTAVVEGIQTREYEDAGHFFDHVGPAESEIAMRLPAAIIRMQLEHLESEQSGDGGWPSPYNPVWRAMATAGALSTLRSYANNP